MRQGRARGQRTVYREVEKTPVARKRGAIGKAGCEEGIQRSRANRSNVES